MSHGAMPRPTVKAAFLSTATSETARLKETEVSQIEEPVASS